MVVFVIRNEDLIRVGGGNVIVPRDLESFILPSQWAAICDAMESSRMQGTFLSCATELVICVIFAFPCIFCCHPCFYQVFTQCEMDK